MSFDETVARHFCKKPAIHPSAFIAANAMVLGDVTLAAESSIWFSAVLRGDIHSITIGPRSNVQDGSIVHVDHDFPTVLGELVTVGHKAIVHGCTVADEVLIGMGATLLDGVEIGARSIIGANALVTQHTKIPPGSLVLGAPAKIRRALTLDEQAEIKNWALRYVELSRVYRGENRGQTSAEFH